MPRKRGSGAGWVRSEAGNWVGRWRDYSLGRPSVLQRTVGPAKDFTKREAKKRLAEIIRDLKPSADMTFAAAAENYLNLKKPGWGKNQNTTSRSVVNVHLIPRIGTMKVGDIKPTTILRVLNDLALTESESMVKKARTHMGSILEMLVEDQILNRNPAHARLVKKPQMEEAEKPTLSLDECRGLLSVASGQDYWISRLALSVGLRPSELFGLRVEDIKQGSIRVDEVAIPSEVPRKRTKTKESRAWLPVAAEITDGLLALAQSKEKAALDFLFATRTGKPISHANWRRRNLQGLLAVKAGRAACRFQDLASYLCDARPEARFDERRSSAHAPR